MGPTVAMGVATTFGVASTGTAISALSGAAATNAALAWLGGGTLVTGGGGMVAGEAMLASFGPVGIGIAGVALLTSGFLFFKNRSDKKHLEEIFVLICKREIKKYDLAIVEINERILRITDEINKLNIAIDRIDDYGFNYKIMTEKQQYELGIYVNLMESSTQLLVNPIMGLQPKYTEKDFNDFIESNKNESISFYKDYKKGFVVLTNMLYNIDLNVKEEKLLWKALKNNKKFLESIGIDKSGFNILVMLITMYRFKDIVNSISVV